MSCASSVPNGLPRLAERGADRGCGRAEVRGVAEAEHVLVPALDDIAAVAEAREVERPDRHDAFEPIELVVREFDVAAISADGGVDACLVEPRAPQQPREVEE